MIRAVVDPHQQGLADDERRWKRVREVVERHPGRCALMSRE